MLWFIICNLVLHYSSLLDSNLCNFFSDWRGKCECISYFSKLWLLRSSAVNLTQQYCACALVSYEAILGYPCLELFGDIKQLYALEENKSLKVARTLKKSSLNPIIVAKTSPQPAICKLYGLYLFFFHSGK